MTSPNPSDPFPLSPCTAEDIPSMHAVYDAAFSPSLVTPLLFPPSAINPTSMYTWFHDRVLKQLSQPELHFHKITDASTGEIAAYLRWGSPHVKAEEEVDGEEGKSKEEKASSAWPEGTNLALADAKFGLLDVWRAKYVDWENTYVAYLLVTSPKYQRRGLATRLLKHVLDQADEAGKKAYIEATPDGFPVYYRLGFREIDRMSVGLEQYGGREGEVGSNVCMVREVRVVGE